MTFLKQSLSLLACLFLMVSTISAQSVVGTWKTIDDETGEAKSYVEIYEKDGKMCGKVTKLLLKSPDTVCQECPGDKKGKPVQGMEILWNLKEDGKTYSGGKIMDPENGKTYKCYIELDGADKLKVRGYIGFAALGRTQVWHRVKE